MQPARPTGIHAARQSGGATKPITTAITVERRQGQTGGLDDLTRGRSALRASYPQAATDATRSTPPAGGIQGRGSAPYTPGARYGNDLGEGR